MTHTNSRDKLRALALVIVRYLVLFRGTIRFNTWSLCDIKVLDRIEREIVGVKSSIAYQSTALQYLS